MPYLINDQIYNDTLTNDIISFEQLGPDQPVEQSFQSEPLLYIVT